jgi:hypothetical protein
MTHIFISHSQADNTVTRQIADTLIDAGFEVWVDFDNIGGGDRWLRTIQENIEAAGVVVVVMSRAAQESEWVERETLFAMDVKKPLRVALVEDMPLPLHLTNRQYIDCVGDKQGHQGIKKLAANLRKLNLSGKQTTNRKKLATLPDQDNFFKYLRQLPDGKENALIARDLYRWAKANADQVVFGEGKRTPGFHVKAVLDDDSDDVTVFSVFAFRRQPKAQVQFLYLSEYPPYDNDKMRRSTLISLNRLLTDEAFIDDQADRRPTVPLLPTLANAENLEYFKQVMGEIFDNLRSG